MQTLRDEVKKKVKESLNTRNRLAYELNKHAITIDRYLDEDNLLLTTPTAVKAIAEELDIPEGQVLTKA